MRRVVREAALAAAIAIIGPVVAVVWVFYHTSVVELPAVGLRVTDLRDNGQPVVRVWGVMADSYRSIKKVEVHRSGPAQVVVVRVRLAHAPMGACFRVDVPIPDGVEQIRFGEGKAIIWSRR